MVCHPDHRRSSDLQTYSSATVGVPVIIHARHWGSALEVLALLGDILVSWMQINAQARIRMAPRLLVICGWPEVLVLCNCERFDALEAGQALVLGRISRWYCTTVLYTGMQAGVSQKLKVQSRKG